MPRRIVIPAAAVFVALVVLRLVTTAILPITEDEAYYVMWGRAPDAGYYDHPPFVAWIAMTERIAPSSALAARVGAMAVAALAFPFLIGLYRRCGMSRHAATAALLLSSFNMYALAAGVLVLPDAVMLTAWCIALHEAAAALDGRRVRWVTAGLAAGAGLLSKYIMILIGPVFLWALIRRRPRDLRGPWPWLGVAAAALAFSPHLAWNAANDWVPMRMQIRHGFQGDDLSDPVFASPLPPSRFPAPDRPESELAASFAPSEASAFSSVLRLLEFAGGVIVVWGAFLVPVTHLVVAWGRRGGPVTSMSPSMRPLLTAATWVPVAFFGAISLVSGVEANWPAVYVIGASGLMAGFFAARPRSTLICVAINAVIIVGAAAFARVPVKLGGPNRLHGETHGWPALATRMAELDGPLLADSHQVISMIRFHEPQRQVTQWPGLTRPSEYLRRPEWNVYTPESLRRAGGFWLLTEQWIPPHLDGFVAESLTQVTDCLDGGLMFIEAGSGEVAPCAEDRIVHRWYLVRYGNQALGLGP